jgi:hypothetical protein
MARAKRSPTSENSSRGEGKNALILSSSNCEKAGIIPLPPLILDKLFKRSRTMDLLCTHIRDTLNATAAIALLQQGS